MGSGDGVVIGRDWNPGEYRFVFNGQEKNQETGFVITYPVRHDSGFGDLR